MTFLWTPDFKGLIIMFFEKFLYLEFPSSTLAMRTKFSFLVAIIQPKSI